MQAKGRGVERIGGDSPGVCSNLDLFFLLNAEVGRISVYEQQL